MGNNCCSTPTESMTSFKRDGNDNRGGDTEGYCSMTVSPVHSEAVVSLSCVQSGLCLSGSKDKSVVLYDYLNKRQEDKWTGHEREITKVCYGSSCLGVFSASRDKTIKMWQRGSSHIVRDFIGHELVVTAIHANSDTTRLCSGSRDNTVKIWDVETAKCLVQSNIPQNLVTDVKWIPNTDQILQTGEDKEVRIFDSRTMNIVYSFIKKQYIQMACDITTDGTYCLTCSNGFTGNGCEASLWDIRTRKLLYEFKGHHEAIESCIFLPNQNLVATASRDCSLKIWNRDTQECITEWCFDGSGPLTSVIAYEDNSILVGTFNQGIQVLELVNDKLVLRSSY